MKYLVFRNETGIGAHYYVATYAYLGMTTAVCVAELEAASRANAAWHLKQALKQGLNACENVITGPHF